MREPERVQQINFGGAHVKAALQFVFYRTDNSSLVLDAFSIGNFKYQLDHGNYHDFDIVYTKMEGLRSTSKVFVSLFFFLLLTVFLPAQDSSPDDASIDVDAMKSRIKDEAPGELVNLNIGDTSVSLMLAGRWKGTLQGGLGFALTPFGTMAVSGDTPIFAQEGDLTLSLWIREKWFVEASFLDNSALNTYRAGYRGFEGEPVRYAGIGNTGLDYPAFPYLDLGGDSPSSFGAYGHFETGNLALHSLIRYDTAAREERVFIGNRERSYAYADPSLPRRGVSFILPDDNLDSVPLVYIQDNKGNLRDTEGRRWRLAEASEYGASARFGLVELSLGTYTGGQTEPEGMIAVAYSKGGNSPWTLSLAAGYGISGAPAAGFLGGIQEWFDRAGRSRDIASLPQCGGGSLAPGETVITDTGTPVLIVYEPGTFSPYEKQNRYSAPVSTSSSAALVKLSTGEIMSQYELIPLEDSAMDAAIQNQGRSGRGIFELVRDGSRDRRSPEERWPLGNLYPELYLPGRMVLTEDIGIRFTSYASAGAYIIGTDVVPGSVQVYRNGIQDPNFVYSPSAGTVNLTDPAGFSEVIRISYLKQSGERRNGSIAAGIGAVWDPAGAFTGRLGLGLRWNLSSDSYSENGAMSPGTVGLGAEAKWDFDQIKTGVSLGLGFEQPDTAGLYRVAGMEAGETILYLPSGGSFISEAPVIAPPAPYSLSLYEIAQRKDLVYRNHRESSILGGSSLSDVSSGAPVISGQNAPYPAMDRNLSAQVLVAEFEFGSGDAWTGFQTPLGVNGEFLERAGKIEIPYRFMNISRPLSTDEIFVYLQIGALSDRDTGKTENPDLVLELKLFDGSNNPADYDDRPRIASFTLNDSDRVKLQGSRYLRLLVVFAGSADLSGRVILAPPIVRGALWRPVIADNNDIGPARYPGPAVNVYEGIDAGLGSKYAGVINRLHGESSRQRVLELAWEGFSALASGPGADGRIPAIPLSGYRSLSFFVRRPWALSNVTKDESDSSQIDLDDGSLRFILARGPSSLKTREEIVLEADIPLSALRYDRSGIRPGEWIRVDIRYHEGTPRVFLDGKYACDAVYRSAADFSGHSSALNAGMDRDEGRSSYAAFFLVPGAAGIPDGSMAFDEIFLEDSVPSYRLNNGASVEWTRPGTIWSVREVPVISDFAFQAAFESGAQGNPFTDGGANAHGGFGMNGRSRAGFSLLGLSIGGNYSYSLSTSRKNGADYSWAAGHSLYRAFGPFSVRESFDDAPAERTMNHRLVMALQTRVRANISGETMYLDDRLSRRWQAGTGGRPAEKAPLDFSIDASAGMSERLGSEDPGFSNYAVAWLHSFGTMLPNPGRSAESRDMRGSFRIRLDTSPLGAELFFQGNSAFTNSKSASLSSSLTRLDFPISPGEGSLRMLYRMEREYRRESMLRSTNYGSDAGIWGGTYRDALPLMFSVPVYSLFDTRMGKRMDEFGGSAGSYTDLGQFADRNEFSLRRDRDYGLSSFFVPNRFAVRLGRVLERKLDTSRDTLNLGANLGFSSVNMFGAMGAAPLFRFYQGDEFSHSVDTVLAFPRGENISWSVRADESAAFFGFSGSELSIDNAFTINLSGRIGEGSRWTDSFLLSWTISSEKTLLGSVYAAFARMARRQSSWLTLSKLADSEYALLRRESLEFIIEKIPDVTAGDYIRFSIEAGHESSVRIYRRLNLSVFAKLRVSKDYSADILTFLGTVGTSLNLMF